MSYESSAKAAGIAMVILGIVFLFITLFSSCGNEYKYEGLRAPAEIPNSVVTRKVALLYDQTKVWYLQLSDTTFHTCKMDNVFANKYNINDTIK